MRPAAGVISGIFSGRRSWPGWCLRASAGSGPRPDGMVWRSTGCRRGRVRSCGARRCESAVTIRRPSPTSSTAWSFACSPTTSACCPTTCSRGCCGMRFLPRRGSASWPANSSGRWRPAAASASRRWPGSTAACLTTTPRCRWRGPTSRRVLAASDLDWSGDRPVDPRHAVRAGPRSEQARPARGALHRPGQDHAARRAGGDQAAARRVGRREYRDHRRAGTSRSRQVPPRPHEAAERGRRRSRTSSTASVIAAAQPSGG